MLIWLRRIRNGFSWIATTLSLRNISQIGVFHSTPTSSAISQIVTELFKAAPSNVQTRELADEALQFTTWTKVVDIEA